MTQANATGLAFSWIQREKPVRCSAESGSELPAMNPATQAKAWSASTSELRNRISSTFDRAGGIGDPGDRDRASGQAAPRTRSARTTARSASATETPAPDPAAEHGPRVVVPARQGAARLAEAPNERVVADVHSLTIGTQRPNEKPRRERRGFPSGHDPQIGQGLEPPLLYRSAAR